jgi:hypothetical protein
MGAAVVSRNPSMMRKYINEPTEPLKIKDYSVGFRKNKPTTRHRRAAY